MNAKLFIFMAAVAVATPSPAQKISFDDDTTKANPQSGKLICEKEDSLGSRLNAQKICLTKSQWEERRREQRETLEKFQRQQTSVGSPSG